MYHHVDLVVYIYICITLRLLTHCNLSCTCFGTGRHSNLLYCIADIAFLVSGSKKCSHRFCNELEFASSVIVPGPETDTCSLP